jgi:hypothetical protein
MLSVCEAPRPQAGASRARSGERKASKGNILLIVPLDPAWKAGLAGDYPANGKLFTKLEEKMGGAVTTAFVFLLLLLMFGALGFMFGNFD